MNAKTVDRALGLVLCAVDGLNFASAASRYVAGRAILGADEVQVYAMVWLVFVGGALVAWRRTHLRMDVLSARLGGRAARLRDLLEHALAVAACGAMSWVSLQFVAQIHRMGQHSDGAGIPMWIPHAAVLVGFVLMTGAAIVALARSVIALSRSVLAPPR
jgi:TRAP-type C4-dicarboxylate transport system permease small subunit